MADTHKPRHKQGKPAGDNPQLIALGDVFAERRRELGILQQDLAEKAGLSRSTLHTIEHGGSGVRWEKIAAVAEALDLEMAFTPKTPRN
ncbi:helix-turn-helix domain-containing protein [Corynebacterium minutissimum]|uniref:Helix-turn-helix transcriptional regulator n=1 Tax=Corynebacterium minutissimum TaxID=38301 RepID=A0A2X4RFP4_9CORY|nr:helix-turn-helix transcriptional regulator [Corynebacterium minutissimum]KHO30294.1 XRE family transcriptional regulator [Corynebacterium minutissimum]MCG7230446.1 helix-turn-helix domain-containing protein [Corynebacterium minutissimum]MCG7237399.1 helix-turn-helix domain-containing protein [Corynebacterium minutissimum]QPS60277.1 helix-turn-helix transcriptional regulator [Corynebacterium minutissimum]QQA78934.1 helix-turn-helix transcriptional regulator [Corynebacterium minutissimum]